MNNLFYGFLVLFAIVSLVGGLNWLMTAINSWNEDEKGVNIEKFEEEVFRNHVGELTVDMSRN